MSDNFRDLERPDPAHRKDQVLMAAISGLECLERPTRADLARFSRLFMPLYAAASPEVRRTASAALSRLKRLPDDVADMLVNEPIAIAAPFIAHYPLLKESTLARAVARKGAPHARAAARRSDLSPQAIATLRSLNDPSVEGLLILRGLIPDPARTPDALRAPAAPAPSPLPTAPLPAPAAPRDVTRPVVAAPPLDPSDRLRSELRALAQRGATRPAADRPGASGTAARDGMETRGRPGPSPTLPLRAGKPAAAKSTVGTRAPAQPLNRALSPRAAQGPARAPAIPAMPAPARAANPARLDQLARYAKPDQASWFATALADAMEASYALAERIMMDLSGRQLATALIALGAPETTIRASLESFFPHLAQPSPRHTLATDLIASLDAESCTARLDAWLRADSYTNGGAAHVPALADGKPVRRETGERAARQDTRRGTRKTG